MDADLSKTEWIPAADLTAGDLLVDWHDEHGRGVFDSTPQARRISMVVKDASAVVGHTEVTRPFAYKPDKLVEVQR